MYVGWKSEMSVFFCFFFPTEVIYRLFQWSLRKKQKNVSFYGVCMYVRPKLTFVSFFCFFLSTFPYVEYSTAFHLARDPAELPQAFQIFQVDRLQSLVHVHVHPQASDGPPTDGLGRFLDTSSNNVG